MAEATLNDVSQKLSSQLRVDEVIARGVNSLRDEFQKLYGLQEKLLRSMAESAREGKSGGKGGGAAPSEKEAEKSINPFFAAAIVAAVAVFTAVKDYFSKMGKLLKLIFKGTGLSKLFSNIGKSISSGVRGIGRSLTNIFGRLGKALKVLVPDLDPIRDAFKSVKGYFSRIRSTFSSGADDFLKFFKENSIFKTLKSGFTSIKNFLFGSFGGDDVKTIKSFASGIVQRVSDFFKPIRTFFSADGPIAGVVKFLRGAFSFAAEGSGFLKMLTGIGRVIGRLAWPITVLMGLIDGISGAFEGFTTAEGGIATKLLKGFMGGLSSIIAGIIGVPFDLLKDVVAWIAGKFGFDQVEAVLKDFSLADLIKNIYMSPITMMKRAFNGLIDMIANLIESTPIPFVDEKAVADKLRGFKFEDEGESYTEMVSRKKTEDKEAGEALDAYDAEQGLGKKKYTSKKLAQAAAGPGETVVQDDEGNFRIKKKAPQEIKTGQLSGKAGKFVDGDALAPVPATGPTGAPIIVNNDNSNNVSGGGTTLAGETRPSTANGQAEKTGFYRTSGGF